MELLKNLSEAELTSLRDRFLNAQNHALSLDEFDEVLTAACESKPTIDVGKLHLRELFNDIDINGDDTVSWEEFTMFLISGEPTEAAQGDDKDLKRYNHVNTIIGSEIPNSVVETRYLPKLDKAMRVMRREKSSRLRLCYPNKSLNTYLEVPRSDVPILSAEYIPLSNDVLRSGTMAVSYSDSVVRFYETKPSTLPGAGPKEMPLVRETKLLESQTVLRWSSKYSRLVMGSRTGVVSVIDVDQPTVYSKEKLHNLMVSDMILMDDTMFTSSLEVPTSVKCVDLQRSVVRFALDGHAQGCTTMAVSNYHTQLFTAGFELFVLAYSVALPRLKPYKLDDQHRPHKGRIIGLQAIPDSPQVITADSHGLVKVWDLRMYNCVQNITPSKDDTSDAPSQGSITSIGFLPTRRRLVANGRDTTLYEYDEASSPHLSDDNNCTTAVYNPKSHSFLSVHDNSIKLWDAESGAPRLVQRALVPTDITCICLATPLGRRCFAGTAGGKLYNIGYAMAAVLRVYEDFAIKRPGATVEEPIVCLHYMEAFRDTSHQYVVVGLRQQVALVPDAEEHVQRSILNLHCFDSVLTGNTLVKTVSVIHSNFVVVATTDGRVHVADLTSFALVYSFGHTLLKGEVSDMWIHNLESSQSQSSALCFLSDATGKVHCVFASSAARWLHVESWLATGYQADSTDRDQKAAQLAVLAPRKKKSKKAEVKSSPEDQLSQPLMPALTSANSVVGDYFNPDRSEAIYTAFATCLSYAHSHGLLLVGDDKGFIAVWDVSKIAQYAPKAAKAGAGGAPQPILVKYWHIHKAPPSDSSQEITSISHFTRDGRLNILSTCADKTIVIHSLDGVSLGNLAQGRSELEQAGVASKKIDPFLVNEPPASAWAAFDSYAAVSNGEGFSDGLASSAASLMLDRSASTKQLMALVAPRPPSSSKVPAFLTDLTLPQQDGSNGASLIQGRLPIPVPPRLQGLVRPDKMKVPQTIGKKNEAVAPLSHTTLPPISSPRSPRGSNGGFHYPTQVGEFLKHSDYLRSNLCANSDNASIPHSNSEAQEPLQATPNLRSPRPSPLHAMKSKAKEYLRQQGHNEHPFETMKEHSLRTKGNVVLGTYTEASNRVN